MDPLDLIFDTETGDPDDLFCLMLLTAHPAVRLRAVTVMPGTRAQVGIVRWVLRATGHGHVPVGSYDPDFPKPSVSRFLEWLAGEAAAPEDPDGFGEDVLADALRASPGATLLTGAPLGNPSMLLESHPDVRIARWVGQGGFAGANVVEPDQQLPKFAGMESCRTYNFNLDPEAAFDMLGSDRIAERRLVSKNVCHGVVYDEELHQRMRPLRSAAPGYRMMVDGMAEYLRGKPGGKKFHDPLAACVAIDPSVCRFREVELYRVEDRWGSKPCPGSGTWISVGVDRERFVAVLQGGH